MYGYDTMIHPDDENGGPATMTESVREYVRIVGADRPDQEWVLSPFDTWERNPYYRGKPGPHPEDEA